MCLCLCLGCKKLTDSSLSLLPLAPRLGWLSLSHCDKITQDAPLAWDRLPELRVLSLEAEFTSALTDAALLKLGAAAPALEQLNLTRCSRLTAQVNMLAHTCLKFLIFDYLLSQAFETLLPSLTRLTSLSLSYASKAVSDRSLSVLAAHCMHLVSLDLSQASSITDASAAALASARCTLLSLKYRLPWFYSFSSADVLFSSQFD